MVRRIFVCEKTISWACFEASGLNNIFHLYPHCDILDKSSLRDSDEELESRTTEKIEVSSAKSLTFEVSPSGKSLIQTKNNKGSKTEPCGTPALICDHFEVWPFRKTHLFQLYTYSSYYNLTQPISRGLIAQPFIFCSLASKHVVNRLENVHQLNISRGKKLGFQLPQRQPL